MGNIRRLCQLVIAAVLLSTLVFGEVKTFIWTAPTEYEDGTPLLNSDIKEYQLHCNSGLDVIISNDPRTDSWISQDTDFPPGFYTCWIHAVSQQDVHSVDSSTREFTVQMQFEVKRTQSSGCI